MAAKILGFLNITAAAMVAGALALVFVGFRPFGLPAEDFVAQQQMLVRALGRLMSPLGMVLFVLTLLSAYLHRYDRKAAIMLLAAAAFVIFNTLVSLLGNVPINEIVGRWQSHDPPANWADYRDRWWLLNNLRVFGAFMILFLASWPLLKDR